MIQVCDFLADILAEFMQTDRSRLGSESACASASGSGGWAAGPGPTSMIQVTVAE